MLGLAVMLSQPDPTVNWSSFETRMDDAFDRLQFQVLSRSTCDPDLVAVPYSVLWHPRRWRFSDSVRVTTGFPDGAERYIVARGQSSPIECCVRYVDGRASAIDIRPSSHVDANRLRSDLASRFPGLCIRLTPSLNAP